MVHGLGLKSGWNEVLTRKPSFKFRGPVTYKSLCWYWEDTYWTVRPVKWWGFTVLHGSAQSESWQWWGFTVLCGSAQSESRHVQLVQIWHKMISKALPIWDTMFPRPHKEATHMTNISYRGFVQTVAFKWEGWVGVSFYVLDPLNSSSSGHAFTPWSISLCRIWVILVWYFYYKSNKKQALVTKLSLAVAVAALIHPFRLDVSTVHHSARLIVK